MKKLLLLTLFLLTESIYATTQAEEKMMALKVLKKYTETVACATNFEMEKKKPLASFLNNVFTIARDIKYGEATYYVVWSGDVECAGGSGTDSYYVSKIYRNDAYKPFLVINDEAFGKAFSPINARLIDSIKQTDSNHFVIIASKYAKGDSNCCPSLMYEYRLSKKSGYSVEWVMDDKKRLK